MGRRGSSQAKAVRLTDDVYPWLLNQFDEALQYTGRSEVFPSPPTTHEVQRDRNLMLLKYHGVEHVIGFIPSFTFAPLDFIDCAVGLDQSDIPKVTETLIKRRKSIERDPDRLNRYVAAFGRGEPYVETGEFIFNSRGAFAPVQYDGVVVRAPLHQIPIGPNQGTSFKLLAAFFDGIFAPVHHYAEYQKKNL